ncbi:MAG: hypothetical protein HOP30_13045 [Cyclobacteriaceae bacterium]|nr:hypothetical protein [Cyclobacteriaceae bacterium]
MAVKKEIINCGSHYSILSMKDFITLALVLIPALSSAQFVAKMEIKEPIEGLCDPKDVYALLPMFQGQEEATCPGTREDILARLNEEVQFLKDNPKFNGKGMIGLIINCKGQVLQCKMDNKTKSEELDKQIEKVFNSLGEWKAGKLNGKDVDSSKLFSFKIKKGQFVWE